MEVQQNNNNQSSDYSVFWIIVKIVFVGLIIYLGIKFFAEKREKETGYVERKNTKPITKKRKKEKV